MRDQRFVFSNEEEILALRFLRMVFLRREDRIPLRFDFLSAHLFRIEAKGWTCLHATEVRALPVPLPKMHIRSTRANESKERCVSSMHVENEAMCCDLRTILERDRRSSSDGNVKERIESFLLAIAQASG